MRISDWSSDVCSSDVCSSDLRCVNQFEYVRIRTNRSPAIYATLITRHLPMASIDSFMRERRRYHEPRRYAAQRQRQGRRSSSAPGYLLSACLIGALAGGGWSLTDPDRRQAFRSEELSG